MGRPGHDLNISVLTGILLMSLSLFLLAILYEVTNGFSNLLLFRRDEDFLLLIAFGFCLINALGFLFRIKSTRFLFILPFIGLFCFLAYSFYQVSFGRHQRFDTEELLITFLGFVFLLSFIVYLILIGTHRDVLKSFKGNEEETYYDSDILDSE